MTRNGNDEDARPILVNVETAARLLGISRSEAYQMVARGELPTVRSAGPCASIVANSNGGPTSRRASPPLRDRKRQEAPPASDLPGEAKRSRNGTATQ